MFVMISGEAPIDEGWMQYGVLSMRPNKPKVC